MSTTGTNPEEGETVQLAPHFLLAQPAALQPVCCLRNSLPMHLPRGTTVLVTWWLHFAQVFFFEVHQVAWITHSFSWLTNVPLDEWGHSVYPFLG